MESGGRPRQISDDKEISLLRSTEVRFHRSTDVELRGAELASREEKSYAQRSRFSQGYSRHGEGRACAGAQLWSGYGGGRRRKRQRNQTGEHVDKQNFQRHQRTCGHQAEEGTEARGRSFGANYLHGDIDNAGNNGAFAHPIRQATEPITAKSRTTWAQRSKARTLMLVIR